MAFIENKKGSLVYMTAENISAKHAFTTRYGGVSTGILSSLNLGENRGDKEENVRQNYAILCSALDMPQDRMVYSKQVHETDIRISSQNDFRDLFSEIPYTADGLITNEENLPIIIFTADCIPILLYDPVCGVIGAVHAGWRGTADAIAAKAVKKMAETYGSDPANIRAAIGPGIGKCCFETHNDVYDAMYEILGDEILPFVSESSSSGKYFIDLKNINKHLMVKSGVCEENISVSEECTMCCHEKYWSHRYTRGNRGSQASVIML